MKRVPTDREILEVIYRRYYASYTEVSSGRDAVTSDNKIYLPVDLVAIADELGVDGNVVFGRLYYYLNQKHAYKTDGGAEVRLFWLRFGSSQGPHQVNFPMLASVLAALQEDERRVRWTRRIAIGSLVVATAALAVSTVTTLWSARVGSSSALTKTISNSAWVLWQEAVLPGSNAATVHTLGAYETKSSCEAELKTGIPTATGDKEDGARSVIIGEPSSKVTITRIFASGTALTWQLICLPDTIDPRAKR